MDRSNLSLSSIQFSCSATSCCRAENLRWQSRLELQWWRRRRKEGKRSWREDLVPNCTIWFHEWEWSWHSDTTNREQATTIGWPMVWNKDEKNENGKGISNPWRYIFSFFIRSKTKYLYKEIFGSLSHRIYLIVHH